MSYHSLIRLKLLSGSLSTSTRLLVACGFLPLGEKEDRTFKKGNEMENFKEYSNRYFNPQECDQCHHLYRDLAITDDPPFYLCQKCWDEDQRAIKNTETTNLVEGLEIKRKAKHEPIELLEKAHRRTASKIIIRESKDFIPAKPWVADLIFTDGYKWIAWCYGYSTQEELIEHCLSCFKNYRLISNNKIELVY